MSSEFFYCVVRIDEKQKLLKDNGNQNRVRGPGEDPYPIGIRAMGKNIERAIQGSLEQGLLRKPLRLEDVYYRTTLKT